MNSKTTCVVYSPITTFSGYGSRSRDVVKSLFELKGDEWDIKLIACNWGSTPKNFIKKHQEEWGFLEDYIIPLPLTYRPNVWIQITVPNEFQAVGDYNIGITAGIETTLCAPSWLEGLNKMDLNLVSSQHAKDTFLNSKYERKNQETGEDVGALKMEKPMEILFEGAMLDKYHPLRWQ